MRFIEFLNRLEQAEIEFVIESNDMTDEFHTLVGAQVSQAANGITKMIENVIKAVATKIKPWAIENLHAAQKIGKDASIFKKIINDPELAAKQLVVAQFKKMASDGKIPKELQSLLEPSSR